MARELSFNLDIMNCEELLYSFFFLPYLEALADCFVILHVHNKNCESADFPDWAESKMKLDGIFDDDPEKWKILREIALRDLGETPEVIF